MSEVITDPDLSEIDRRNKDIRLAFDTATKEYWEEHEAHDHYSEMGVIGDEKRLMEILDEDLQDAADGLTIARIAMTTFYAMHKEELHTLALEEDAQRSGL